MKNLFTWLFGKREQPAVQKPLPPPPQRPKRITDELAQFYSEHDFKMRTIEQFALASFKEQIAAEAMYTKGQKVEDIAKQAVDDAKALYDALSEFNKQEQERSRAQRAAIWEKQKAEWDQYEKDMKEYKSNNNL